jgi:hypothetical protein
MILALFGSIVLLIAAFDANNLLMNTLGTVISVIALILFFPVVILEKRAQRPRARW